MNENIQSSSSNAANPGAIAESIERVARTAHSKVDSASNAAHPAIDRLASGAHSAIDSADNAAIQAKQALDKAGMRSEELVAAGNDFLREHPLFTLGVAVAAGYVLSRIMASR